MENNKNILYVALALIAGIVLGFMLSSNQGIKNQGAQTISSDIENIAVEKGCEYGFVYDPIGKACESTTEEGFIDATENKEDFDIVSKLDIKSLKLNELKSNLMTKNRESDNVERVITGKKVFKGGEVFSFNICEVATETCPGFGSLLNITLVGGGSGGVSGEYMQQPSGGGNYNGGAGGGGGGAGAVVIANMSIPINGSITTISGLVGRKIKGYEECILATNQYGICFNGYQKGVPVGGLGMYGLGDLQGITFMNVVQNGVLKPGILIASGGGSSPVGQNDSDGGPGGFVFSTLPVNQINNLFSLVVGSFVGSFGAHDGFNGTPNFGSSQQYGGFGGWGALGWPTSEGIFGYGGKGGYGESAGDALPTEPSLGDPGKGGIAIFTW